MGQHSSTVAHLAGPLRDKVSRRGNDAMSEPNEEEARGWLDLYGSLRCRRCDVPPSAIYGEIG